MSLHKSFASKSLLGGHRNVLTRAERIAKLKDEDRWKENASVFGIAKVRNLQPKKKKGKAKKEGDATAAATPAAGATPAAPAAGAKPGAAPAAGAKAAAPAKGKPEKK